MRQFPSRYAFRARRNLPDKEMRSSFPNAEGLYLHPFYNGFAPHLRVGGILISQNKIRTCDIWSLDGHIVDYTYITARKVATALVCLTYNRSSPTAHF